MKIFKLWDCQCICTADKVCQMETNIAKSTLETAVFKNGLYVWLQDTELVRRSSYCSWIESLSFFKSHAYVSICVPRQEDGFKSQHSICPFPASLLVNNMSSICIDLCIEFMMQNWTSLYGCKIYCEFHHLILDITLESLRVLYHACE